MNIINQINAGLNDVRASLVEASKTPDMSDQIFARQKAHYQLNLVLDMIEQHRQGIQIPWSDRKHQVTEEFSE